MLGACAQLALNVRDMQSKTLAGGETSFPPIPTFPSIASGPRKPGFPHPVDCGHHP